MSLSIARVQRHGLVRHGTFSGACAAVLSVVFIVLACRVAVNRSTEPKDMEAEKHLFAYSVFYLFALFTVLVADRFLA